MITRLGKRGQSTLELAILTVVVIGAFIAMNSYMNRGMQNRIKSASDEIGGGDRYEAGNTNAVVAEKRVSTVRETFNAGSSKTEIVGDEVTNRVSKSVILNTN